MKGFVGFLIGLVVGGGIGAGTAYVLTKRADNKKNDEEIAKLEEYYKSKIPARAEKAVQPAQDAPKCDEKPSEEAVKLEAKKEFEYDRIRKTEGPKTDYSAKYKISRGDDVTPIPEGNEDWDDPRTKEICQMVIISGKEWDEDDEYEKREITYYEQDEIFTDIYNNEIDNLTPDDIGRANLEHFGITGEEGVLYVRSEDTKTDYRINYEEGSLYSLD